MDATPSLSRRARAAARRAARRAWHRVRPPAHVRIREELARLYVRGHGLELGALHRPLRVPPGTSVTYVDRLPVEELRRHYPELEGEPFVDVDLLDDGERLATVADASVDFVIANHFLEHAGTASDSFDVRDFRESRTEFVAILERTAPPLPPASGASAASELRGSPASA